MLSLIFLCMFQTPQENYSLPFIKADTICNNKQNETDKTLFTYSCIKKMVANYKPTKVYLASYDKDGKENYELIGESSCIYMNKDHVLARIEINKKLPNPISSYILNAKTYSAKGDFFISTSCVLEISGAEIKSFVLRPKEKAILFE